MMHLQWVSSKFNQSDILWCVKEDLPAYKIVIMQLVEIIVFSYEIEMELALQNN